MRVVVLNGAKKRIPRRGHDPNQAVKRRELRNKREGREVSDVGPVFGLRPRRPSRYLTLFSKARNVIAERGLVVKDFQL